MRMTITYALGQIDEPFWPIGLCIAWVRGRGKSKAALFFARRMVFGEARPSKDWADARTMLLRALAGSRVSALGLRSQDEQRVSIRALEWIDLRIEQRGLFDEVRDRDGLMIAYRDVRIAAESMRQEWPAETAAAKRAREKLDAERVCLEALKQRMTEKPNEPVAKKTLVREFPAISGRALDRCYARAARETGAVAWSKAGRRRRQRSDSPESSTRFELRANDREQSPQKIKTHPRRLINSTRLFGLDNRRAAFVATKLIVSPFFQP